MSNSRRNPCKFVSLFCLLVSVIGLGVSCDSSPSSSSSNGRKAVNPGVGVSRRMIIIKNCDTSEWPALTVYINGMPPSSWHSSVRPLKPGQVAFIDLDTFAKDDGARFKPDDYKVTEVWIGGGSFDYGQFGFKEVDL